MQRLALLLTCTGAFFLQACATDSANYKNPSTFDLLFKMADLNAYLEKRESELTTLKQELSNLDTKLEASMNNLLEIQDEIRGTKVKISKNEQVLKEYRADILTALTKTVETREKLNFKRTELDKAKTGYYEKERTAQEEALKKYNTLTAEIKTIQHDVEYLTARNEEIISNHAQVVKATF